MGLTVEWFGCATFRVRTGSATLFFDTYLDKAPDVPDAGPAADEVEDADFLFISHAHFDHVLGADVIARATGATVVGNYETAHLMAANDVPDKQVLAVAGGETVDCGDEVTVRVLPAQHSCLFAASGADSGSACLGDLGVSARERRDRVAGMFDLMPTISEPLQRFFGAVEHQISARDGGQLAYLLESPDGSLLVNASSGYWRGIFASLQPDVAILAAAGRPNIDGEPYQGSMSDFLVEQADLLGCPEVILCHHDALLPPVIPAGDVSDAEQRLRDLLGPDRYRTLTYDDPVELLV